MKLTQTRMEEVISEVLGAEGLRLIKELKDKENVSEFTLSSRLKKDIKIIRHMLYKLYNHNLVAANRKKDRQKGWYIYYWTLLPENIKFFYLKNKQIFLNRLKEQLQREQTEQFYSCSQKCVRLDFDHSLELEFRCPECGQLLSLDQNLDYSAELEKKIEEVEAELKTEGKPERREKPIKKTQKKMKKLKTVANAEKLKPKLLKRLIKKFKKK